jgi:hypothetical protein
VAEWSGASGNSDIPWDGCDLLFAVRWMLECRSEAQILRTRRIRRGSLEVGSSTLGVLGWMLEVERWKLNVGS